MYIHVRLVQSMVINEDITYLYKPHVCRYPQPCLSWFYKPFCSFRCVCERVLSASLINSTYNLFTFTPLTAMGHLPHFFILSFLTRAGVYNQLIQFKFIPNYSMQNFTYFRQIYQECYENRNYYLWPINLHKHQL